MNEPSEKGDPADFEPQPEPEAPPAVGGAEDRRLQQLRTRAIRDLRLQKALGVGLLLAGLAFALLVYLPANRRMATLRDQVTSSATQLTASSRRAARLPEVQRTNSRLEEHLSAFPELPSDLDEAGFLREAMALAESHGLGQLLYEPIESTTAWAVDVPREMPIRIGFAGDFEAAFTFVRSLETMPRVLRVRTLRVETLDPPTTHTTTHVPSPTPVDVPAGRVKAELVVHLYAAN
jgi:Tfp pilus assembly protein PilO